MTAHRDPTGPDSGPRGRPRHRVADVLRTQADALRPTLGPVQRRALDDILRCRTAELGGFVDVCDSCGAQHIAYRSCRNRHCPSCQALRQARWIHERMDRVLPTTHFHVVFTLPSELRPLARLNRDAVYSALFRVAADTLLTFGRDPKHLGAELGITSVLHTWTRDLRLHPHVHCIVTAGGLTADGRRWLRPRRPNRRKKKRRRPFLFPVKALGLVFRARFLSTLDRLRKQGKLRFSGPCADLARDQSFARLVSRLTEKDWVVYAKRPFGGTSQVFEYLGQYTHRVGIADSRILDVSDHSVTFQTRPGQTATLDHGSFARRFLQHTLPPGFTKIRHYGLYASTHVRSGRLERARATLRPHGHHAPHPPQRAELPDTWHELLRQLTGVDPRICPTCHRGTLIRFVLLPTLPDAPSRGPPPEVHA